VRADTITDLIAQHVIPELVHSHSTDRMAIGEAAGSDGFTAGDLEAFSLLAIDADSDVLIEHLEVLIERGVSVDTILVDLLAPAARRLGSLWDEDRCSFVDVTMGLWRLQEALRELSSRLPTLQSAAHGAKRALFATMPGEQHSFGTVIIEDVFRRDGWATEMLTDCDQPGLLDALASQSFDMAGLTLSCEVDIGRLKSLILAMRSVSRNPRLSIMIGGHALAGDPTISTRVGADGTAPDAQRALALASRLVAVNACREVFCA
jgi:methanogenic corrinoid protein MtbC1